MLIFINKMGPFGKILILIAMYIIFQVVRKGIALFSSRETDPMKLERGLHSILFWGAISAVMGVLAQITGIYNALNVIINAKEIDPRVVAQGFAESFTTTLFGLTVLILSSIIWFIFLNRFRKVTARSRKNVTA
jgi:biopolymer transport protein ExbB/TolQ